MNDARTWLPSEWIDEVNPETLAKPDDFIQPDGKGGWRLGYPAGHDDAEEFTSPLVDGQTVDMSWLETFGYFDVIVGEGGEPVPPPGYPNGASHHVAEVGDWHLGDSLGELFQMMAEVGDLPDAGEAVEVSAYTWGDQMHRFEATPSPRLVPVDGATQ